MTGSAGERSPRSAHDGIWIDRGGAWIGPGQDRIYALMTEFGVPSYKQYTDGEAMMVVDGKQYRYTGTVPLTMSPWAVGQSRRCLPRVGADVQVDPARKRRGRRRTPQKWDQITLAKWLEATRCPSPHTICSKPRSRACYTSAASEVSMLFVLFQMASGGGPGFVLGIKDASQDSRIVGGMGAVYRPMAAEIGDVAAPVSTGTAHRPGRRRRDGAL